MVEISVIPQAGGQGIKFVIASVLLILLFIFIVSSVILSSFLLVFVANHQLTIYKSLNNVGPSVETIINNGQSITNTLSNCIRPAKIMWNTIWTFIFAVIHHIGNAQNINVFSQYTRFDVANVICNVILPIFETVVNFLIMVLMFILHLVLIFLSLLLSLGTGNFDMFDVILSELINPFFDIIDPDRCVHPITGPEGFPGGILDCMGCTIPRETINFDTTTKVNAVFVCACGGDIHGDTIDQITGCIHLQDVIDFFESLVGYLETAFDYIEALASNVTKITIIYDYIKLIWNKVTDLYDEVHSAVCKIPFICKIINIRSTLDGNEEAYICSYDTNNPTAEPVCWYEREWRVSKLNVSYSEMSDKIHHQLYDIARPTIKGIPSLKTMVFGTLRAQFTRFMNKYRSNEQRSFQTSKPHVRSKENPLREIIIGAMILLKHLPHSLNTGRATPHDIFMRDFQRFNFRPQEFRVGLRNMLERAKISPFNYEKINNVIQDEEGNLRSVIPPPVIQIALSVLTTSVKFTKSGSANFGNFLVSIFSLLIPLGSLVVHLVIKVTVGLIGRIFPTQIAAALNDIFNPLETLDLNLAPLYNLAFSQEIPASVFATAFNKISNDFNNIISSKFGVMIVQYILSVFYLSALDTNNHPPTHPNITTVNQLFSVMFSCNPDAPCVRSAGDNSQLGCGFSPCNCNNGTVLYNDNGFCANIGTCLCYPLLVINEPSPANTVTFVVDLHPKDFGYVEEKITLPYTTTWGTITNCMSSFWNGGLPYLTNALFWGTLSLPWYTVVVHYTLGACPCFSWVTGLLMSMTILGNTLSVAFQNTFGTPVRYCSSRNAFYCDWLRHFFRDTPPSTSEGIIYAVNSSITTYGAIFIALFMIVGFLFIIILLTSLILLAIYFAILPYRIYEYNRTKEINE